MLALDTLVATDPLPEFVLIHLIESGLAEVVKIFRQPVEPAKLFQPVMYQGIDLDQVTHIVGGIVQLCRL